MLPFKLNIWRILGVGSIIAMCIIFSNIVIYILIASILFLIGSPITKQLERIKIGKRNVPDAIAALITIVVLVSIVFLLFLMIFPPLIKQVNLLTNLNFYDVLHNILLQFPSLRSILNSLGNENEMKIALSEEMNKLLNFSNFSYILNNFFTYAGSLFGGTLCVLFITFFLLKDEQLLKNSILLLTPNKYDAEVREVISTSKKMLSAYFAGLFIDMLIVGTLAGSILSLLGVNNALIIGFTAGILNAVPYIGSALTMLIAIFLGVSGCIATNQYELIGIIISKTFFTLLSINLIDGFIFQPFIFSSSVKAHPLEIFIVILMGATLGGIAGMIIALPTYTILRIIAKEFLSHFKVFKKLTETID